MMREMEEVVDLGKDKRESRSRRFGKREKRGEKLLIWEKIREVGEAVDWGKEEGGSKKERRWDNL